MPRKSSRRHDCHHCSKRFTSEFPQRYCSPKCCLAAEKERVAERLLAKLGKIEAELAQIVVDTDAYNDRRPGRPPIDREATVVSLSLVRTMIGRIEAGRPIEPELSERLEASLRS